MSDPFIGEIKVVPWSFAPRGWALCNGQLLPISQNQALFSVIGATYGGDGKTTFALPDFRGRIPLHRTSAAPVGFSGGEETHTLIGAEMAGHGHGTTGAPLGPDQPGPGGNLWAQTQFRVLDRHAGLRDEQWRMRSRGRRRASPQPASVPGPELHDRFGRHLPQPELRGFDGKPLPR